MKKIKMFVAAFTFSALLMTSCSTDEKVMEQHTVHFDKTEEMLNFEASLKVWMQFKRENGDSYAKTDKASEIIKSSEELLVSLGENTDLVGRTETNPDEIVRFTLKAYTKKLTEMYRTQIR